MKEILNVLSEMLDKKEVKSIHISYQKVGDVESISASLNKENTNDITVNIDTLNTNAQGIKDIADSLAEKYKRQYLGQ